MPRKAHFEVASGKELRQKYGLTAENRPTIRLRPSRVPKKFRRWIPLAERWGIGDDLIREDSIQKATAQELSELLSFGDVYNSVLAEWLAGPDADSPRPTQEYIAFSCLGMAWDLASVLAKKHQDNR